jgi:adenosylcobinamide kinase / adenosylcobinamide-phosphate guanylyltransferase
LIEALDGIGAELVLVDGLTLYAARVLGADPDPLGHLSGAFEALRALDADLIVVSDEVGMGLVPEAPEGRAFRELLGAVNQRLAVMSKTVYFVAAGLPVTLKGGPSGTWA